MELAFAGRLVLSCVVVAALLYGFAFVVRFTRRVPRRGIRPSDGKLATVVETTLLPDAASLHVVRVVDRYLVLGRSGSHVSLLYEIPAESMASVEV